MKGEDTHTDIQIKKKKMGGGGDNSWNQQPENSKTVQQKGFLAVNYPSSVNQSQRHKLYYAQKARRVSTMFGLHGKAEQYSDGMVYFEQNLHIMPWRTFINDECYPLESYTANYIHFSAGIRLTSSRILPVNISVTTGSKACENVTTEGGA